MKYNILILIVGFVCCCLSAFSQTQDTSSSLFLPDEKYDSLLKSVPLTYDSADFALLRAAGLTKKKISRLSLADYEQTAEKIVRFLENSGYPFATVNVKSVTAADSLQKMCLNIEKNEFVTIDSIVLKGDIKLKDSYLWPYLNIRKNSPYSEKNVKKITRKLSMLPFATVVQPAGFSFQKGKTSLFIYLDKNPTNHFDGYAGFVPVNEVTGKMSLTGEMSLFLQNLFKIGEKLSLNWHSSERYSQFLDLNAEIPYLFKTHFGVDVGFVLDKHDTSFMTLNFSVGVPYKVLDDSYLRPYFDFSQSRLLATDINFANENDVDHRKILYGLTFFAQNLDNQYNPRKGFEVRLDAAAGRRSILKNLQYDESYYEGKNLSENSYKISASLTGYIPVYKYFVLKLKSDFGTLLSGAHYRNEMFSVGGPGLLRGFAQNEIVASTFLLYSAEIRYLFGKKSDFHLFFDGGTYERHSFSEYVLDFPFGFGAGVNVGVRAGILYLEYALPRQHNNKISLKTGKIHVGVKVAF